MSRTLRGLGTGNGDCVLEIAEVGKIKYKVKTQALMKTKACVFNARNSFLCGSR